MTDDRDRRAAHDFLCGQDESLPYIERNLAALLTAARAEGAAEAIEAAARLCRKMVAGVYETPHEEWIDELTPEQNHAMRAAIDGVTVDTCQALEEMLLDLSPAGLVAVSVDALRLVSDYLDDGYLRDPSVEHEDENKRAATIAAADRIRAAVARKGD